jgi:hypothetical protein
MPALALATDERVEIQRPWLDRLVLVVCLAGIVVPLLTAGVYRADFLDLANESTAYRYFFVVRVADGESVVVGVGYLLAAIQQAIYAGLLLAGSHAQPLHQQIQAFAFGTIGVVTFGMALLVVSAYRDRLLRETDRLLVAIVSIVPIWGTRVTGFDYTLMADYHLLNLALVAGATWLFLREWRREHAAAPSRRLFWLGAAIGAAMANKVTLAVVGAPVLLPALLAKPVHVRTLATRAAIAVSGAIAAFVVVVLASYRFDAGALVQMVPIWTAFVMNAGAESEFWTVTFASFLLGHGYATIALFFCLAGAMFLLQRTRSAWTVRDGAFLVVIAIAALGSAWFVIERPAGSTLFETSVFMLTLGAMTLGAAGGASQQWVVRAAAVFWIVYAAVTFSWHEAFDMVRRSHTRAEAKWKHYDEVRQLGAGRPVTVVFPSNAYHHEGVFELLLKGAVEFPTWRIEDDGLRVLARFAPGISYRHDLGGASPDERYAAGTVLVWYETPSLNPLMRYESLARAADRCDRVPYEWRLEGKAGQTRVVARACVVGDDHR